MHIGDRIRQRLDALDMKGVDVTRGLKLKSSGHITQWLGGKVPSGENLINLAKLLQCRVEWLVTGKGKPTEDNQSALPPMNKVPLISFVQAGDMCQAEDPYPVGGSEDLVEVHVTVTEGMYALRVIGDSMTRPSGIPSFPEGMIIVVDPMRQANNGDHVIARDGTGQATFKKLNIEGDQIYLKPLNPDYKPIEIKNELIICGVVVEGFFSCL